MLSTSNYIKLLHNHNTDFNQTWNKISTSIARGETSQEEIIMLADTYSKCELLKNKIKKYIEDIQLIDIEYGIYFTYKTGF